MDQGQVVVQGDLAVPGVGEEVPGDELHPALLAGLPHVVSAQHDLHLGGILGTMSSGQNPLIRYEGSTTEPGVVHEQGGHPGVGVGAGLLAPHDPVLGAGDAALPRHALGALLVSWQPLRDGWPHAEDIGQNICWDILGRLPWCVGGVPGNMILLISLKVILIISLIPILLILVTLILMISLISLLIVLLILKLILSLISILLKLLTLILIISLISISLIFYHQHLY